MNSNGIPEMIRAAGKSRYVTRRLPWSAWLYIGFMIGLALGLFVIPAHASPSCMTHAEAREVWPREYLHWHGDHCWAGHSVRSAHVEMRSVPLPKPKPFILLLEQSEQQEWIYADRWWIS
jgi:hypothetical protein